MDVTTLLVGTVCLLLILVTVGVVARMVVGQLQDRPKPLEEQVSELRVDVEALKTAVVEVEGLCNRAIARERKAEQRRRDAAPEPEPEAIPPRSPVSASPQARPVNPLAVAPHTLFRRSG